MYCYFPVIRLVNFVKVTLVIVVALLSKKVHNHSAIIWFRSESLWVSIIVKLCYCTQVDANAKQEEQNKKIKILTEPVKKYTLFAFKTQTRQLRGYF